ncbi:unnamed protein product [Hermetia illucens]|uniref:Uncharacterized protein n=1 Tax=Hermetia illucens TaxID=343691 RepID=A0A7R8UZP1_HERIL|nr:uncharacterized protein LOC119657370 [Hermetia illucens]CAD7090120.1 unnamed protein product [Hermetia illucens]
MFGKLAKTRLAIAKFLIPRSFHSIKNFNLSQSWINILPAKQSGSFLNAAGHRYFSKRSQPTCNNGTKPPLNCSGGNKLDPNFEKASKKYAENFLIGTGNSSVCSDGHREALDNLTELQLRFTNNSKEPDDFCQHTGPCNEQGGKMSCWLKNKCCRKPVKSGPCEGPVLPGEYPKVARRREIEWPNRCTIKQKKDDADDVCK